MVNLHSFLIKGEIGEPSLRQALLENQLVAWSDRERKAGRPLHDPKSCNGPETYPRWNKNFLRVRGAGSRAFSPSRETSEWT